MVDILTAVLSGANWGPFAPSFVVDYENMPKQVGQGLGHFFGAWQIEAFSEIDTFKRSVDAWIREMRSTPPAPGAEEVLIPGDPERHAEDERRRTGIPFPPSVIADLKEVAKMCAVGFIPDTGQR